MNLMLMNGIVHVGLMGLNPLMGRGGVQREAPAASWPPTGVRGTPLLGYRPKHCSSSGQGFLLVHE